MIRLAVRAPADQAERVLAELVELAPSGVEQVDGEDFVEFAVYGAPGELPELPLGEALVGGVGVRVSGEEVPSDWADRWKRFHVPVLVGGRLYVRPPWEQPAVRPGVSEIVIDPGRAFGTGSHPTTRMCLELMLALEPEGALGFASRPPLRSLVDLGCGSGVLAIAAAKLGFSPVTALDFDKDAVEATLANARDNGVLLDRVAQANLREEPPPPADVLVANLTRALLLRVADGMAETPSTCVASGLLEAEADEVAAAFAPMRERKRIVDRGWCALLLER